MKFGYGRVVVCGDLYFGAVRTARIFSVYLASRSNSRLTRSPIARSRKAYVPPATHSAGSTDDPTVPRMGERFRLKADVRIDGFPPHARAIAQALKTYGMLVADNGSDWRISVAPDSRIHGLEALGQLHGRDFEVVLPTPASNAPQRAVQP